MSLGSAVTLSGLPSALSALATPWQLTYWLLITLFLLALAVGLIYVGLLVYGLARFHVREVPAHLKNVARPSNRPRTPPELP